MPIFIPDRLKTPGEFPSIDANDNQIRGFGFFADNSARTALGEDFRCEGYLAFMKDTDQFKQYNNSAIDNATWGDDANWALLEGTTTDTYWDVDLDGTGIYYSNQVVVGGSTYSGDEKLYVNGAAKVTTSLETPVIKTSSGLDIIINTDETSTAGDDFVVKYGVVGSGGTVRTAFDISPYVATPNVAFGNISDDFKLDHYSSSFSEFRTLSGSEDETGFKFTDFGGSDGSFLIRMKNDGSYFEMKDGGRDLTVTPHFYKIRSTVEAGAIVTHPVEMLMPSTATGDWTFNHLGNKNFVFNTNTGSLTKLITKFHAAGNGVVSIGTANYYNEYNGIQYPTYSASLQPRLFIVNDGTSNVGVRVQSGDTTLGTEEARSQGRYFTDITDDGFYISRTTSGPLYDETAAEGDEWDGSSASSPSAVIGIRRGALDGNSLELFARNDFLFKSNSEEKMRITSNGNVGIGITSPLARLHVAGDGLFENAIDIYRSSNTWSRTMLMFSRLDENSVKKNVGHIGTAVNYTVTAGKGYRFYLSNQARGGNTYSKQHLAILENGDVEIKNASSESSSNLEGDARLKVVGGTSDDTKNALSVNASDDSSLLLVRNDGNVGIGTSSPLAKLHVMGDGANISVGDVAGYNGDLAGGHPAGEAPGNLFINGGGLITNKGTNIIRSNVQYLYSNSYAHEWKPGNSESSRQAVLETNNSSGIAFRTDNRNTDFNFGKYSFSITDNPSTVSGDVGIPLYIKPRFPGGGEGYTGGGVDGEGNVNQSLVHPLYFTYNDAPSTLENIKIRTQVNDAKGASYDYGLDYDATATQGDTGNPFTANKNRLKISATFPFAESQVDGDGRHTSLSGVIGTSEASFEIRNAYETNVSGSTNANLAGTFNTALFVGGQRFFEPRSRNTTKMYGFGGIIFTRASNYGTTGDLSPEDNDLVNAITTDVTGGTVGSYVLSTSNAGEITLSSSTYDTSVDGELSLKVTLNAANNISAVEIIEGGTKASDSTGFRSGDTITIPATKLGSSSTSAVITLSNDSFITDGASVNMGLTYKHAVGIGVGNTSIESNDTNTSYLDLGAGGNFHPARTAKYTTYRDHWFKQIEGTEGGHWTAIQGGFLKGSKLMVGYSDDNQVAYDGTAINASGYGTAALRIVASPSGMRVGTHAVASDSSSVLKFAEADLDAAGFTDVSSTWGVDYGTNGGWYIGMPIYISEAGSNHIISKVRPDGVFQYNSGSDTSTFQRRIVTGIDDTDRELTLDSNVTTSGGDVLVYPQTESDLIRCRNLMGRDMFVVKSNGRLDLENGVMKLRAADHNPAVIRSSGLLGPDECIIWYDGTNLKIIKGSGSLVATTIG